VEITNKFNLPEAIYQAITKSHYEPKEGIYRVTELIAPAMIRKLTMENPDLEVDASEMLFALLGSSVHYLFVDKSPNSISGERLNIKRNGIVISGETDDYNGGVDDYKVTSVYSFLNGVKSEWGAQTNIYAYLWRSIGFEVKTIRINAILRDWKQSMRYDSEMPQIPFVSVEISIWAEDYLLNYIDERIAAHQNPQPCSAFERWSRPDVWAVKKAGNKTARGGKLCYSKDDADGFINSNPDKKWEVEFRKGEDIRCKDYCPVRNICEFNIYRKENNNGSNG
jgi:hypothetical protein